MRYRDRACGITRASLRKARKNLGKLGEVTEIRGYRFTSTRTQQAPCQPFTGQHEAVLIKGPKGSYRVEGVLWSYYGEGPRGLVQILEACGLDVHAAEAIAFKTPRGSEDGTDFSIKFPVPIPVNPHRIYV